MYLINWLRSTRNRAIFLLPQLIIVLVSALCMSLEIQYAISIYIVSGATLTLSSLYVMIVDGKNH